MPLRPISLRALYSSRTAAPLRFIAAANGEVGRCWEGAGRGAMLRDAAVGCSVFPREVSENNRFGNRFCSEQRPAQGESQHFAWSSIALSKRTRCQDCQTGRFLAQTAGKASFPVERPHRVVVARGTRHVRSRPLVELFAHGRASMTHGGSKRRGGAVLGRAGRCAKADASLDSRSMSGQIPTC